MEEVPGDALSILSLVERYRERTSESERYHEFMRSVVSKGSEQFILLVEQREESWERKGEQKRDGKKKGSADAERKQG